MIIRSFKNDFKLLEEKKLQKYVTLINNEPKERPGFLIPNKVFNKKLKFHLTLDSIDIR